MENEVCGGRDGEADAVEDDHLVSDLTGDGGGYETAAGIDRDDGVASQVVGVDPVGNVYREE